MNKRMNKLTKERINEGTKNEEIKEQRTKKWTNKERRNERTKKEEMNEQRTKKWTNKERRNERTKNEEMNEQWTNNERRNERIKNEEMNEQRTNQLINKVTNKDRQKEKKKHETNVRKYKVCEHMFLTSQSANSSTFYPTSIHHSSREIHFSFILLGKEFFHLKGPSRGSYNSYYFLYNQPPSIILVEKSILALLY